MVSNTAVWGFTPTLLYRFAITFPRRVLKNVDVIVTFVKCLFDVTLLYTCICGVTFVRFSSILFFLPQSLKCIQGKHRDGANAENSFNNNQTSILSLKFRSKIENKLLVVFQNPKCFDCYKIITVHQKAMFNIDGQFEQKRLLGAISAAELK